MFNDNKISNISFRNNIVIEIFNRRGGYDFDLGKLKIIRRLKDENYQYTLEIKGPLESVKESGQKSDGILEKLDSLGGLEFDLKKSLDLNNSTVDCITELEVLEKNISLLKRR